MRIKLPTGTPAELARPTVGEATGGLVLWPDICGLRPVFDAHVQRLADDHSLVVVAPEMYPGEEDLALDARHARAATFSDDDKLSDALAAADATGFDHVGVLGFCMGGMLTFLIAANRGAADKS